MRERMIRCALLSCVFLVLVSGPGIALANVNKATLCHVPPGNADAAHEIVVSESALEAHLKNHADDFVGTCEERCRAVGACNDGNACTIDACKPDGGCDNSQAVDCADGDVCTIDACDPLVGCVNPPVPDTAQVGCDDGNACSASDMCVAGVCHGNVIAGCCGSDADCPASDACATRYCEDVSGTCKEVDTSSQCTAGACEVAFCDLANGCGTTPAACADDGNICTLSACNPDICGDEGGCETFPNPNPPEPGTELTCDDGLDNDCDGLVDTADSDCPTACPCWTAAEVEQSSETSCEFRIEATNTGAFIGRLSSLPAHEFFADAIVVPGIQDDEIFFCYGDTSIPSLTDAERNLCQQVLEDTLGECPRVSTNPS